MKNLLLLLCLLSFGSCFSKPTELLPCLGDEPECQLRREEIQEVQEIEESCEIEDIAKDLAYSQSSNLTMEEAEDKNEAIEDEFLDRGCNKVHLEEVIERLKNKMKEHQRYKKYNYCPEGKHISKVGTCL